MKNSDEIIEAFKRAHEELMKMSPEEFNALFETNIPSCDPETCGGECQGMGWCETAEEFRKEQGIKL